MRRGTLHILIPDQDRRVYSEDWGSIQKERGSIQKCAHSKKGIPVEYACLSVAVGVGSHISGYISGFRAVTAVLTIR